MEKREEIRWLFELVRAQRPRVVLEIGLDFGGTFFLWSRAAAPEAHLLAIDTKPVGRLGMWSPFSLVRRAFAIGSQRVTLLMDSDSHSETTRQRIATLLDGRAVDFLFIHGDHSCEGVWQDFKTYSPLSLPADLLRFTISLRIRQTGRKASRSFGDSSPSSTRLRGSRARIRDRGLPYARITLPSDFKFGLAPQLLAPARHGAGCKPRGSRRIGLNGDCFFADFFVDGKSSWDHFGCHRPAIGDNAMLPYCRKIRACTCGLYIV